MAAFPLNKSGTVLKQGIGDQLVRAGGFRVGLQAAADHMQAATGAQMVNFERQRPMFGYKASDMLILSHGTNFPD